jgi:hypothetical protein
MKKINFYQMQNNFIINEGKPPDPDINAYVQSLEEIINSIVPRSHMDMRRLSLARENIKNIRRHGKRLQQENSTLKEKLRVLEESE